MKRKLLITLLAILSLLACALALSACGDKESDNTPSHTHSYTEEIVFAPTCTKQGYTLHACSCYDCYADTYTDALGHNFENYVSDRNATCTANGTETAKCSRCEETATREVEDSALGHNIRHASGKAETCTQKGYKAYDYCTRCNYSTYEVIPAAHDVIHHDGKAETCTQKGYKAYDTCTRCYYSTYQEIAAAGHTFVSGNCKVCNRPQPSEGLEYKSSYGYSYVSGIGTCTETDIIIADFYDGLPVTDIRGEAFKGCTNLTSVTIPDSVTYIGGSAFGGCSGFESITVDSGNSTYHSAGNCLIKTDSKILLAGCNNSVIPDDGSVTKIGDSAFEGCTNLTSVTIPDSVIEIGWHAFCGCSGLTGELKIPDSVTEIGSSAFSDCSRLTSVIIGNGITEIRNKTFENCHGLISVTLGKNFTSMAGQSFLFSDKLVEICNLSSLSLSEVEFYFKVLNIYTATSGESKLTTTDDGYIFYADGATVCLIAYMGTETNLTLPENYNGSNYAIWRYAFYGCTNLTSVTMPDRITAIGDYAFYGCTNLSSITIPDSITVIGDYTFYGCINLSSITILGRVTEIGGAAFYGCTNLTSVTIPGSVTKIGGAAFYGCTNLTSVTIPGSVTKIGYAAFKDCTNLTSVMFNKTSGWKAGNTNLYVSSPSTAATYITTTYCDENWYNS